MLYIQNLKAGDENLPPLKASAAFIRRHNVLCSARTLEQFLLKTEIIPNIL
jgi:hypothetical protein